MYFTFSLTNDAWSRSYLFNNTIIRISPKACISAISTLNHSLKLLLIKRIIQLPEGNEIYRTQLISTTFMNSWASKKVYTTKEHIKETPKYRGSPPTWATSTKPVNLLFIKSNRKVQKLQHWCCFPLTWISLQS